MQTIHVVFFNPPTNCSLSELSGAHKKFLEGGDSCFVADLNNRRERVGKT